jgi:hypothetical protein
MKFHEVTIYNIIFGKERVITNMPSWDKETMNSSSPLKPSLIHIIGNQINKIDRGR